MHSFFYLTPLFLYFPHFIPGIETQPLISVLFASYGIFALRIKRPFIAFITLTFLLTFWIVIKIGIDGEFSKYLSIIQLMIGPLIFFGALSLKAKPPSRATLKYISISLIFFALFEFILPSAYQSVATTLIGRASITDGHRGISLFTPEPTYAAISGVYWYIVARWSGKYYGFQFPWIEPVLMICTFATGSTYLIILFLAYSFVTWPRLFFWFLSLSIFVIVVFGAVPLDNEESVRAIVALSRLLTVDFSDFLPSISALDSSIGSRLATNAASFLTFIYSPTGLGLDCSSIPTAFEAAGYYFVFDNDVLSAAINDGCLKPQSYLATVFLGLGMISFIFLALLAACIRYACTINFHSLWLQPISLAFIILVVQGQLTNPIPWLLVYIGIIGLPIPSKLINTTHH